MGMMSTMALSPAEEQYSEISINPIALQKRLLQELLSFREERQQLLAKLRDLGGTPEPGRHLVASVNAALDLKEDISKQADAPFEVSAKMLEMDRTIQFLEQRISAMEEKKRTSHGRATAHRIKRLEELLKGYGGSQAFKQLQSDLGLSPSQFTRLVKCLDKRRFDIQRCPGAQRGEKMLSFK
jgi:hypothetical protein